MGAALVVFALMVAVFWPFTESKVKAALQEEWPGEVQIGSFRSLILPHPGCVLRGVQLSLRSGSQVVPIATIEESKIEARYADFLVRPHFIANVILNGLHAEFPEQARWRSLRGTSSSQKKVKPSDYGEILDDDSLLTIARAGGKEPLTFEVHRLKLTGVRAGSSFSFETALHNAIPPGQIQATGKFGPWNLDVGKSAVSGRYTFHDADLSAFPGIAGILFSTGHFSGALEAIEIAGRVDTPNFEVVKSRHAVPLKAEFSAVVNGKNGDVLLRQVNAYFLDTEVVGKGTIARLKSKHGKYASLDLAIARGRINDVLRLFVKAPQPPMQGVGKFSAHVNIPPGPQDFLHRVELSADFTVTEARFSNLVRQKSIEDLSRRASGKKAKDDKDKGHAEHDPEHDPIRMELHSRLRLANAVANFSGLQMNVPGAEARLAGNYMIDSEKVNLHGDLRTEAPLSKEASGIKSILLKPLDSFFKKKQAGADVPVGITGTYSNPKFGIELPPKKPPAAPAPPTSRH